MANLSPCREQTFNPDLQTDTLSSRAARPPDFAAENQALVRLAQTLGHHPHQILPTLVDTVITLCRAGSSGISLLERETADGPLVFRWRAVAGAYTPYLNATSPRDCSPCALALESQQARLLSEPARFYPHLRELAPHCFELLLVPLNLDGEALGTLWAAKHDPEEHFEPEDERLLQNVAAFACAGCRMLQARDLLDARNPIAAAQIASLPQANALNDTVLATIAHELRNPLWPLRNAAYVLRTGNFDATVNRVAALVERQVTQMNRLVDDLLDISRIRLGRLAIKPVPVKLSEVVRMAVEASQPSVEPPSHPIRVRIADEDVGVHGDPIRLVQVLENLINNAAKYSDPGSGIAVTQRREGATAIVEVTDEGIGIAAEQMEAVFTLFAQAGQADTKRSRGGLGIGLHLARQLVVAHAGTLTVTSDGPGRGSTFTMRLPCS